jgi:Phage capsid protein
MADSAFQIQYRQEFIAQFEQGQSYLRTACTTEAVIKGNQAVFLVAGSGNATPVQRGLNGNIPPRTDSLSQITTTLTEWHDKPQRTEFNIFASQGDGRRIMQMSTVKVMNRQIDQDILAALNTATNNTGSAQTGSLALVTRAKAHLALQDVDITESDNLFFIISPAFEAYLSQIPEFARADYVSIQMLDGTQRRYRRWLGFNFIVHQHVPGVGSASESCFAYHRAALGHAVNSGEMDVRAGYNEENAYYWARSSIFMGSAVLQNSGILVVNHNGAAYT